MPFDLNKVKLDKMNSVFYDENAGRGKMKKYFIYFISIILFCSISYTRVEEKKAEGKWQRFEKVMKNQKVKFIRLRGKSIKIHMLNIKETLKKVGIKGVLIIELRNKFGKIIKKLGKFKDSIGIPNVIIISDIFTKKENRSFSINFKEPDGILKSNMHFYADPKKFNFKEIKFGADYKGVFDTTSHDIGPYFRSKKATGKIRKIQTNKE